MEYLGGDGGEYYIQFGHKVELVFLQYFKSYFTNGMCKIDKEFPWLSATSDAIFQQNNMSIPVEIKSMDKSRNIDEIIQINYHQLNITAHVFDTPYLYLVVYQKCKQEFSLYKVFKADYYVSIYYPLLERSFYKYLLKSLSGELNSKDYDQYLTSKEFKSKFLKHYNGNFTQEEQKKIKRPTHMYYEKMKFSEIFPKFSFQEMSQIFNSLSTNRVQRRRMFYRDFEKLFKANDPIIFKDYDIQRILVDIHNQLYVNR